MSIYVEILIRAPMETLWAHTQTPELHQRWDLRFSRIDYLPRESETEPQRFRYATRLGFGIEVVGEGESLGERDLASGSRSSALKFNSDDSRSIIREGAGYWKYIPTAEGVIFLTSGIADVREWYDEKAQRFRIVVGVHNKTWGPLFGYRGSFEVEWRTVDGNWVPSHILPHRQERRE